MKLKLQDVLNCNVNIQITKVDPIPRLVVIQEDKNVRKL